MIFSGTLLLSTPPLTGGQLKPDTLVKSWPDESVILAAQLMSTSEAGVETYVELESWAQGTCRECLHRKNKGSTFRVPLSPGAQLVLSDGEFRGLLDLEPNLRVATSDCDCSYLEIKRTTVHRLPGLMDVYSICVQENDGQMPRAPAATANNFGISDGKGHSIFLAA